MDEDTEKTITYTGELIKRISSFHIHKGKILHQIVVEPTKMPLKMLFSKNNSPTPINFTFIFDDKLSSEEKEAVIEAGKSWSKNLTSNLNENLVIKVTRSKLDYRALAATSNFFCSETSYQNFIKTLSTCAVTNINKFPNSPCFNLPKICEINKYGYTLANLRCLTNTCLKSLVGADYDAEIMLNSVANFTNFKLKSIISHEIGHVLGFVSGLDELQPDTINQKINLFPLDLYRFNKNNVPQNEKKFEELSRELIPNPDKHIFCNLKTRCDLSTGVYGGDGYQASHWKCNDGIMISSIYSNQDISISNIDLDAMVSLGYGLQKNKDVL